MYGNRSITVVKLIEYICKYIICNSEYLFWNDGTAKFIKEISSIKSLIINVYVLTYIVEFSTGT